MRFPVCQYLKFANELDVVIVAPAVTSKICPMALVPEKTKSLAPTDPVAGFFDAVFRTTDGGCNAVDMGLDPLETPFSLRWWRDRAYLVTRNFEDGSGSLWEVGATLELVRRWTDLRPDAVLGDADRLWISAAQPVPTLLTWDGQTFDDRTPTWPEGFPEGEARLDRLAPRLLDDGGIWLIASAGTPRVLWWTDGQVVLEGPGPVDSLMGPARVGDALAAVVDGVLWTGPTWAPTDTVVDWTCLHQADPGVA